jgi:integrase
MPIQLTTDADIRKLPAPKAGMAVYRDSKVRGLGIRILPETISKNGKKNITRAFILDYTANGRRRVYTIGKLGEWTLQGARTKAKELKDAIKFRGLDPAQEAAASREAPSVDDLCDRFETDHMPGLRLSTRNDYARIIKNEIRPKLGKRKVGEIKRADIEGIHRAINERGSPVAANICLAICSKLFSFATDLEWTEKKNPAKGIKKYPVEARSRYLSSTEISALTVALAKFPDQDVADIFRLLLLTGARRGEVRAAQWDQFNITEGIWTKSSSHTKQKKEHRVPIAAAARQILSKRRSQADAHLKGLEREIENADKADAPALMAWMQKVEKFVFPAKKGQTGHIIDLKKPWAAICKAAGIPRKGPNAARVHDLRHTAASILASSGSTLNIIGQLLGHTQVATTLRYAHLFDHAQREALDRLGAVVSGGSSAQIIKLNKIGPRKR